MEANPGLQERYGKEMDALVCAYHLGDEVALLQSLDALLRLRERGLFLEIGRLSRDLQAALERFRVDSRLVDLAEKDVPDARQRLAHVLKLTDEAAHQTLDLVERSCPLAERTSRTAAVIEPRWQAFRARRIAVADFRAMLEQMDGFLADARADAESVRRNLSEVLLAQGYQDITGQILRGVMQLVGEVEAALGELVELSRADAGEGAPERAQREATSGPVVPGVHHGEVVSGQQDVDALLSGLGV